MTGVGALAVPGLALHDHAVIRAGELSGCPQPRGHFPQPCSADARIGRAIHLGASLDDQVTHRFAVDAAVVMWHIEAAEFQEEIEIGR
jgi:hypothetical protein